MIQSKRSSGPSMNRQVGICVTNEVEDVGLRTWHGFEGRCDEEEARIDGFEFGFSNSGILDVRFDVFRDDLRDDNLGFRVALLVDREISASRVGDVGDEEKLGLSERFNLLHCSVRKRNRTVN